jgi:hypothetical protein
MKTVLVKTGYAGEDRKYSIMPDRVAAGLAEAVDWILKRDKSRPCNLSRLIS